MRVFFGIIVILLSGCGDAPAPQQPSLTLESGVLDNGTASPAWTEGIAVAIGIDTAEEWRVRNLPMSAEAAAWFDVLQRAIPDISARGAELATLFDVSSINAVIVAGNRGSSDGFGWVPDHIGINVQAMADTYGPPDNGAMDRMTRIAAHEYLHLLTYAYYPEHLDHRRSPIDRALWTIFFEGIGDYVSASSRWLPDDDGNDSPQAAATLAELEPVFVDRLERLFDADETTEHELRVGIASGRFDRKWGSLPFALWLHREVRTAGEAATLRAVMREHKDGVLEFAERHIDPSLRDRIRNLRQALAD